MNIGLVISICILAVRINSLSATTMSPLRLCDDFSCDMTVELVNKTFVIAIPHTIALAT